MHSTMKAGGSSLVHGWVAHKFGKPLLHCPTCGEETMELICGQGSKVPGAIFFKCRLHERDVDGSCPFYLFADKYEKMLIAKGIIKKGRGSALPGIRPEETLPQVDQLRIAIGHMEGVIEANKMELAPLLADVVTLKNGTDRVDEKLQYLLVLGKITTVCLVVVAMFAVICVIIMLFK